MRSLLMVFGLVRLFGYATDPLLDRAEIHAIAGEPARIERPAPASRLTVVSWNIAQGARYEEVRDALAALDADIYLLQEVDRFVRRSDYRDVARDLAHALGMNWVFAGEFQEIGQARRNTAALTGQAILSRYPISDAFVLRFRNQAGLRWKLDPFQPRRGGRMALRAESGGILLYNAHIESAKNDAFRHKQIDEIVADHDVLDDRRRPVILAGDFNTARPPADSVIVSCLTAEGFEDALADADGPRQTSIRHEDPLDWMFVRNMVPGEGRVVRVEKASDHFPLAADVMLPLLELAAD
jgi:endonuclease/exonuclease/phosphatase family metal-dependent hydrolase